MLVLFLDGVVILPYRGNLRKEATVILYVLVIKEEKLYCYNSNQTLL